MMRTIFNTAHVGFHQMPLHEYHWWTDSSFGSPSCKVHPDAFALTLHSLLCITTVLPQTTFCKQIIRFIPQLMQVVWLLATGNMLTIIVTDLYNILELARIVLYLSNIGFVPFKLLQSGLSVELENIQNLKSLQHPRYSFQNLQWDVNILCKLRQVSPHILCVISYY